MSLAPGRDLSHYRLVEQIGEGGMGVVWKATDTTLGRDVAIKVLPEAFARDPERMARFEREARVLASLNHSNIAAIYGVGSAEGVRFLAMELVTGEDLAARVAQGPLPMVESLEIGRQVAEALEAAHEKGVIHRDLKPANVKVTPDGHAKVLDFGLAKALEGEAPAASSAAMSHSPTITGPMTGANVILGTAAYMSPEQARGKVVDRRADIWAFGCVLLECLTGRRVFEGETVSDTLARILEREPDLKSLPSATPPRIRELLQRCLVKDPKLRLRDIGDARIVLEEVLAARTPSGRLVISEAAGAGGAPRRLPIATLAVAGVIGLALGALLWGVLGSRGGGASAEPTCVALAMSPAVTVLDADLTPDGRTLVVLGVPKDAGRSDARPRLYARSLDGYEFKLLPGTEGAIGTGSARAGVLDFIAPAVPGSPQMHLARVPLDGSAPATTIADWKDTWIRPGLVGGVVASAARLSNGDLLVMEGATSFVRLSQAGSVTSSPVQMDAGRPGVSFFQLRKALPGDRGVLVNIISYDARGWHYSVGVMDAKNGKVKVVVEDGGNAVYSPTGHLLFARADAILAAGFDPGRAEVRGSPVAVWNGLSTAFTFIPAGFSVTDRGALFYRPGQAGGERALAIVDAGGKLEPWSPEVRMFDSTPQLSPDGRRFVCTIVSARGIDEILISPLDHPDLRKLGTDPSADSFGPIWSPDGASIAYIRFGRDERDGVYIQEAEGGEARRVLKPESDVRYQPGAWLPDGSALLATRFPAGKPSIVSIPLGGREADSSQVRPVLPTDAACLFPRLSRDGRLLAFSSDESGKQQTWVAEMRIGQGVGRTFQVKTLGSTAHAWSPDGRTLFVQDERNRLMKVTVSLGPPLSVSAPVEVADLDKQRIALWSPLPEGRLLVALKNANEEEATRYDLVLNWTELLKRKLRAAR